MNQKLVYKHGQEKHFEIYHYPDGQKNVRLDLDYFNDVKTPIDIECSIRNFNELEILLCIVAALKKNDFALENITYNYLFGMRSDRAFEPGTPNYFRDVLSPIISQLNCGTIWMLSPHSILAEKALLKCNSKAPFPRFDGYIMIGADQHARIDEWLGAQTYHFDKKRVSRDKLEIYLKKEFKEKTDNYPVHMPILIYDDLCDGGATFIAIAEYLKEHIPNRQRHLYVTHGLFTKGVDHVAQHFDKVITTNSYQEFEPHEKLEVLDVWR